MTAQRLSEELVSQAPVVRAVDLMLRQAVKDQASDIHLDLGRTCACAFALTASSMTG